MPPGPIAARWFPLLALCLVLLVGQKGFGQTITLSTPVSGTTYVDNMPCTISISDAGGVQSGSVKLLFTYTSGYYTASIGQTWTLSLLSSATSQSSSFNPSTATSNALFSSVSPSSNLPDGVYSVKAQYTRTTGGMVVTSTPTLTSIAVDTQALPPALTYSPTVTIDTATSKDTSTGKWKLTVGLQKSTDQTNYTAFPFVPSGTSVNGSGQVEFTFTVPETSAGFRLTTI